MASFNKMLQGTLVAMAQTQFIAEGGNLRDGLVQQELRNC